MHCCDALKPTYCVEHWYIFICAVLLPLMVSVKYEEFVEHSRDSQGPKLWYWFVWFLC